MATLKEGLGVGGEIDGTLVVVKEANVRFGTMRSTGKEKLQVFLTFDRLEIEQLACGEGEERVRER